jgi:hypothetical protein
MVNLCDTCVYEYPVCPGENIFFGRGLGNDNVIECDGYDIVEKELNKDTERYI